MSQNDLVIANQTFPATRADINSALQAIGSLNSGSTAPTTTYANMLWYDTGTNTLKMRSEADDAWFSVGDVDSGAGTFTPSGTTPLATQIEAEDGTDNTVLMTPLRTKQAMTAFETRVVYDFNVDGPVSDLNFTGFSDCSTVEFELSVQLAGSSQPIIQLSSDGSTYITSGYVGASVDGVATSSASTGLLLNRVSDDDISGYGKIIGMGDSGTETAMHGTFGGNSTGRCISAYTRKTGQAAHQAFRIRFGATTTGGRVTVRGLRDL
jgi:hypothetical protein